MRTIRITVEKEIVEGAVSGAIREASGFGTGSSVAEVADIAADLLAEESVYMTPEEDADLYATITRSVLERFGLSPAASDATELEQTVLVEKSL
jgi:hypothetical protein